MRVMGWGAGEVARAGRAAATAAGQRRGQCQSQRKCGCGCSWVAGCELFGGCSRVAELAQQALSAAEEGSAARKRGDGARGRVCRASRRRVEKEARMEDPEEVVTKGRRVAAGGRLLYYSAPELPNRRTDWDLCLLVLALVLWVPGPCVGERAGGGAGQRWAGRSQSRARLLRAREGRGGEGGGARGRRAW